MKKASEYRRRADNCRQLAARMGPGEQREQLLGMAKHWDQLAKDRAAMIRAYPHMALDGEEAEERSARPSNDRSCAR